MDMPCYELVFISLREVAATSHKHTLTAVMLPQHTAGEQ